MSVIVTDSGFAPDTPPARLVDLPGDASAEEALAELGDAPGTDVTLRITFPAMGDGRGFTLARRLRLLGFAGRLRAAGGLICEQYAMARRVGFDEVEISDALAARQPEPLWLSRADWRAHDHQQTVGGRAQPA